MNKYLLFFVLVTNLIYPQGRLRATILDSENKEPIPNATIFISNTTLKVVSNSKGYFEIDTNSSNNDLIISSINYETAKIDITSITEFTSIKTIYLQKKAKQLNTIVVKSKKPKSREKALATFKTFFIGNSELASKTEIINEDAIHFQEINENESYKLIAYSDEPLQIINKNLGYKINYELIDFEFNRGVSNEISFSQYKGYAHFIDIIEEYKLNSERVFENRKKAYLGSSMHFFRSLYSNKMKEEGYLVTKFIRKPNPKFPSQSIVNQMWENRDHSSISKLPPKYIITNNPNPITENDLILIENDKIFISFQDFISVKYTNEKEDSNYSHSLHKTREKFQKTELELKETQIEILPNGNYIDNDKMIFYGHMSWEKVGDMLPFNYDI